MSYTKETADGKILMKIVTSLTIYDTPSLHEAFLDCSENGEEVMVDAGEVIECDAAGVQLLYAACINTRENLKLFRVLNASGVIVDTLNRLGLDADKIVRAV